MTRDVDAKPGTYALLVRMPAPGSIEIGRLGRIRFDAPYFMYFGSAFGPGGLGARIKHHLAPVTRPHWHIDYLRSAAAVCGVWYTTDAARLECTWCAAASKLRGASPVPGFGASDCGCVSHLVAVRRPPSPSGFRRHVNRLMPGRAPIRRLQVKPPSGRPGQRAEQVG